jgi:hypothetical protein
MTRGSKLELLEALRPRYGKAGKKAKGRMLDEFCAATKYNRKYAIQLLRHGPLRSKKGKRGRRPCYGRDVTAALVEVWQASGHICGKRLHPFLSELVEALERHGELRLAPEVKGKLLQMSRATIDRRLQRARSKLPLRGRTTTKPGSLLKSAIPIRTFADWDDARPGFLEIDLVAHCGETTAGEYLHTLSAVDIDTRWYEPVALPNRSQKATFEGIRTLRYRLPFPLLGLDSDGGGEFTPALAAQVQVSTITCTTTARRNRSPSLAPAPSRRTTRRMSSRRTGRLSVRPSVMSATIATRPWPCSSPSTRTCACS